MLYCVFKGTRTTKGASNFDILKVILLLDNNNDNKMYIF